MAVADDPWANDLATVRGLVGHGLAYGTVRRRIRVGTWLEPLSGVVCRTTGSLTRHQWLTAALLYAGPDAALSHATAVGLWKVPIRSNRFVVTVHDGWHPSSTADVWVRQSARPFRISRVDGLSVTPPARSLIDASLDLRTLADVESLLGRGLQAGLATLDQLSAELAAAPSSGSRHPRLAIAEMGTGARAASEARLARLIQRAGLPMPEFNAAVSTSMGMRYIDALWRQMGKGVEVDGQAFHLGPREWLADLARQNAIQSQGIVLLRIAARRLWTEPAAVLAEIRAFLGLATPLSA